MPSVRGACRPGKRPPGQDRWGESATGIVVLDGATAYSNDAPDAGKYVDQLRSTLLETIDGPDDLPSVLEKSISTTTKKLGVRPGSGPSSTVLMLRKRMDVVELLVLGDSTAIVRLRSGETEKISDERLARVAPAEREEYRARLRDGFGYDNDHRDLLRRIQAVERQARNTSNGYWIAEGDPKAARQALTQTYPVANVDWVVFATDGAQRPIDHLNIAWEDVVARAKTPDLRGRLEELHSWEEYSDPDGRALPRSKRHDDKTLVIWTR